MQKKVPSVGDRVRWDVPADPLFRKVGPMTGCIGDEYGRLVFLPDREFHDRLLRMTGVEPLSGLWIDGPDCVPGLVLTPI